MNEFTKELMEQAVSGNQNALTCLYELTYSSVYKTVKVLVRDEDAVLDIVQDSYIKGFQSLSQLETPAYFPAWIKRIATNKAKDYLKEKRLVLFSELETEDGDAIEFQDERTLHYPEEVLERNETARLLREILDGLSDEQRVVIGMFYYEEMSVREIAEILECSENTVKSRLNYGRKKIEVQVRALEKQGTKLYALAPIPFLVWLFQMDVQAAEIPSAIILQGITTTCGAAMATAEGTAAAGVGAGAAKSVAASGAKAIATKVIAGAVAVALFGGGVALGAKSNESEPNPVAQVATAPPSEEPEVTVAEQIVSQLDFEFLENLFHYLPLYDEHDPVTDEQMENLMSSSMNYKYHYDTYVDYPQIIADEDCIEKVSDDERYEYYIRVAGNTFEEIARVCCFDESIDEAFFSKINAGKQYGAAVWWENNTIMTWTDGIGGPSAEYNVELGDIRMLDEQVEIEYKLYYAYYLGEGQPEESDISQRTAVLEMKDGKYVITSISEKEPSKAYAIAEW